MKANVAACMCQCVCVFRFRGWLGLSDLAAMFVEYCGFDAAIEKI